MTTEVNNAAAATGSTNTANAQNPPEATPTTTQPKETTSAKTESASLLSDEEPGKTEQAGTPVKTDVSKDDPKQPEDKNAAPEKYEFQLPEGRSLDESVIGKFTDAAKELGLSNEKAQKLVTLADEHAQIIEKRMADSWAEQRKEWVDTLKSDKDFGGDKLKETVDRAKRVLNENDGAELREFLITSGLGDNHLLIKFLAKLDKKTGEDQLVDGKSGAGASDKTAAQLIYGH